MDNQERDSLKYVQILLPLGLILGLVIGIIFPYVGTGFGVGFGMSLGGLTGYFFDRKNMARSRNTICLLIMTVALLVSALSFWYTRAVILA